MIEEQKGKPIVSFVIPIAPKSRIDYWDDAMVNLNRTLRSLDNQTSDNYNIFLITTDTDKVELDKDYRNLYITPNRAELAEFSEDKDNKTRIGLECHTLMDAKFFFRLDWDDLIHREFVRYIEEHECEHGWAIQYGYFYRPDIYSVILVDNYWQHCGSSLIINYTKEECENGPKDGFHHQQVPKYRQNLGKPLSAIPFRAGMYTIHGNNISTPKHEKIFKDKVWESTFQDDNLHKEFGL